jgi:hypothetical protein
MTAEGYLLGEQRISSVSAVPLFVSFAVGAVMSIVGAAVLVAQGLRRGPWSRRSAPCSYHR